MLMCNLMKQTALAKGVIKNHGPRISLFVRVYVELQVNPLVSRKIYFCGFVPPPALEQAL